MAKLEKLKQRSRELHTEMIMLKTKLEKERNSRDYRDGVVLFIKFQQYSAEYCLAMLKKDDINKQILEIETGDYEK